MKKQDEGGKLLHGSTAAALSTQTASRTLGNAVYEPPVTTRTGVQTEGGFCAASVINPDREDDSIHASGHEIGGEYDFSNMNDSDWK